METKPRVSILILTHNALRYVYRILKSLRLTSHVSYEVIVVDNHSRFRVKMLLLWLQQMGWVNKLCLLDHNSLFAAGNNIAARLADSESSYLLLLNSDVEIRHPDWLKVLLENHERGITSYGIVKGNPITRVDGFCLLIDKDLYQKHTLDESFQWWWNTTKLQAKVLIDGYSVKGFVDHERYIHHFRGKSGSDFKGATGMDLDPKEAVSWFQGRSVQILDTPR
jgi:hypothetical protein